MDAVEHATFRYDTVEVENGLTIEPGVIIWYPIEPVIRTLEL